MLNISARRIWLHRAPADMRKSYDGLSAMVRRHFGREPSDGQWYAFLNRRRTQVKVLAFESGGYCLWSKRLEQGQFGAVEGDDPISAAQFLALLEGLDWQLIRRRKRFEKSSENRVSDAAGW